MEKQRLSKVLAAAGVASRRACEKLIFSGRVKVNGKAVCQPQVLVSLDEDGITVDGKRIPRKPRKAYYLLNKPKGYICSNRRINKRTRLVLDLFEGSKDRLFTVGRLDKETTGLLLVTNDGHFAHAVIHPSSNIQKEYVAKTDKEILDKHLKFIDKGVVMDGLLIKPRNVEKVRRNTIKIVVMEGKKREVRQLLKAAGLAVIELKRTRIGNLRLGSLREGSWRKMTHHEKDRVFD